MRFETKFFDDLTARELYEILRARADVFVGEEKILYPDADGVDYDCLHIFSRDEAGTVTAYLRMFPKQEEPGTVQIGRVLTRRRGGGLGRRLMEAALRAATETFHAGGVMWNPRSTRRASTRSWASGPSRRISSKRGSRM